ncbi:MAG TPA: VOC family protein [Pyrinomonadaceae bacterium]|nr:VOC family protein [Pyrinomonadaceae bacterium]
MFTQIDYTMVVVSDMARSVSFYRDTLGIPLKFESPDWTEFLTGATTLALHGGGLPPDPSAKGNGDKYAGTCSIGFNVKDVDETYEELKAKGAKFVMPPTQREGEGIKLAVCIDPDGLPIAFAQSIAQPAAGGQ